MNKQKKKKLSVRIWDALFPPKNERAYAAAKRTRLNADWPTTPTGANYEQKVSLSTLIARSRIAARDYLHIASYLQLMRANVIGRKGIQLQSRARKGNGKLNVKLNQHVEEEFWKWGQPETCTLAGNLDWKGVQDLCLTQRERDGAFLIQMIDADNEYGFSLKVWDVTWFDFTYNDTRTDGNRIIMSIEFDARDKPVAYWLTTPTSEMMFTRNRSRTRTRIPAEQMIHGFRILEDASQVHGVPELAPALLPAKNTYSYVESVTMASRVSANQFAILKNTSGDAEAQFTGKETDDGNETNPLIDSSPLAITQMLPGWELQQFKPDHPTQNHPAFKETLDMDVATALRVPYFLLMGNWKAVNFSSSRGGLGEFRERCKSDQEFYANTLCRRVFHAWVFRAWLHGKLDITAAQFNEIQNPAWQPRGFAYVDPTKDAQTDVLRLQNRLTTPSRVHAEGGEDYADFLKQWAADKELAQEVTGTDIDELYAPKQTSEAPAEKPKESDDDDTDDDDEEVPPKKRELTNGHDHEFVS
ncbi:MAG: phage portal protein [Chloracidobacterium sp.]|nr:phage portal protein [Chloracidobacterium sp.]